MFFGGPQETTYSVVQGHINYAITILLTTLDEAARIILILISHGISTTIYPNQHRSQRQLRNKCLVLRAIEYLFRRDNIKEQAVLCGTRVRVRWGIRVRGDIAGLVEGHSRHDALQKILSNILLPNGRRLGADATR